MATNPYRRGTPGKEKEKEMMEATRKIHTDSIGGYMQQNNTLGQMSQKIVGNPPSKSELAEQTCSLDISINLLERCLEDLAVKLEPVMNCLPKTGEEIPPTPKQQRTSALTEELQRLELKIERLTSGVLKLHGALVV